MTPTAQDLCARLDGGEKVVCVPVPLSAARRRERGFNQAAELARGLSAALGIPLVRALRRAPGRGRQAGAGARKRRENVQGTFRPTLDRTSRSDGLGRAGSPILLVDDVLTTGATIVACVDVLREAGFGRIAAITFARTLKAG